MGVNMKPGYLFFFSGCIITLLLPAELISEDLYWHTLPCLSQGKVLSDSNIRLYLSRYGLDTIGSYPIIGTFKSDSFICVGQIYRPHGPSRGTVIFLHGLSDHLGTNLHGIIACLKENYTFAAFDLPGHGLSSGMRGGIGDFSEYARSLHLFLQSCDSLINFPLVFIGHSTGCAAALEYVTTTSNQPFSRMIFLAPLVRSSSYHFSVFGFKIFRYLKIAPRRWPRSSSHDKEVKKRLLNDPLQSAIFPLQWAEAYFRWFERIKDMPPKELPLTVIQGTDDNVVDWKYNLQWFEKKIKGVRVVRIEGARHNLLNESRQYRQRCFDAMQMLFNELDSQN